MDMEASNAAGSTPVHDMLRKVAWTQAGAGAWAAAVKAAVKAARPSASNNSGAQRVMSQVKSDDGSSSW